MNSMSKIFLILMVTCINSSPIEKKTNLEKAKEILDKCHLIDGHNDLAWMVRKEFRNDIEKFDLQDMTKYNLSITHTDINRIKEGRLKGQFWSIYAPCTTTGKDATRIHLEQIDVIKRLMEKYPDVFQLVTSSTGNLFSQLYLSY